MQSKTTFYLLASLTLLLISAVALFLVHIRTTSAAATLGDATNKTTLGNDLIGNSKYIYNLAGLSLGTSATSSNQIILGAGGSIKFPDNSTQSTAFTGTESVLASRVSSDVFGRLATKGNYTFEEATNTNVVFFVDATNARIGVKTNSPQHALDIAGAYYTRRFAVTPAASTTINWHNSNVQSVVLNQNIELIFSNGQDGGRYLLILKQGATGGPFTVTWPTTVRWSGGSAPTLSTGANKTDYIGFIYNGIDAKYDGLAFNANF